MSTLGIVSWVCCSVLVGSMLLVGEAPALTVLSLIIIVGFNLRDMLGIK